MYQTIYEDDFVKAFLELRPDNFSKPALYALFNYFEDYEDETKEKIELDVIAICCDFTEYQNAYEAMQQYQSEDMPLMGEDGDDLIEIAEKEEAEALKWLEEHTDVIVFDGGIIIKNF